MKRPTSVNFSGMSALVADSNENFINIISGMLREFGASQVHRAMMGEKALEIFKAQRVDFAFFDCFLPGVNGFLITREIRAEAGPNRSVPIMILTSHTQEGNVIRARDEGAAMVMAKPISGSMLYDRLAWAAGNPRDFIMCDAYNGPDRRHKIEGFPGGVDRRETDKLEVGSQKEPDLAQNEIDALSS